MIFIDWISPPNHKNFNIAFFSNLSKESNHKIFIFSKNLIIKNINCVVKKSKDNRFWRLLDVINICKSIKNKPIFFLTYDPLFLPLIWLFTKKIYTYDNDYLHADKIEILNLLELFNVLRGLYLDIEEAKYFAPPPHENEDTNFQPPNRLPTGQGYIDLIQMRESSGGKKKKKKNKSKKKSKKNLRKKSKKI